MHSALLPSKRYSPLLQGELYRKFANLEISEEAILGFARKFGHLGIPQFLGQGESDDPLTDRLYGEPLWAWKREIRELRKVLSIWGHLCSGDRTWLKAHFRWEQDSNGACMVIYDDIDLAAASSAPGESQMISVVADDRIHPEAGRLLRHETPMRAARVLVSQAINAHLGSLTSSQVLIDDGGQDTAVHIVPTSRPG